MFATIFFCVLEPHSGNLVYVNAGHEPVYVIDREGKLTCLSQTGPAVGLFPQHGFECGNLKMQPGDILFAYTDGVTNARSSSDQLFSRDRLEALLTQAHVSESELIETIKTALYTHIGAASLEDDITILTIQCKPH
jgi:serine phosphatase RsbU (regulator of sigma subunit)